MNKTLFFLVFASLTVLSSSLFSQSYDALQKPNTYQSDDNPHYWKNKKPHAAYWQQDVYYDIKANLDDQQDFISGVLELTYTNNSPDTLDYLVFHLYQNAFDSGSYASEYHNRKPRKKDKPFQSISIKNMTVNGIDVKLEQDNTILFVSLPSPLRPGEYTRIECEFKTQFGPIHGRMKMYNSWGYKHYNVVHWYPRISVYDHKFGWTTDQHLGHEFYGDFGAFDVELTLPEHYILDGTGFLTNRNEVLPDELREKLDIKNFSEKPWNDPPSEIIPKSSATKTWRFHAENVHDFAWTADPTYRIGEAKVVLESGHEVTCYALAQESHAAGWQNAADYATKVIDVFSRDFGEYAYHKMILADARDGMEYPMLTLDGGRDPGYRGLLAHEIGHNWFFGMVGNNETYRASLDEGFTQFLTAWALTELEGDTVQMGNSVLGIKKPFQEQRLQRDLAVYDGYYFSSIIRDDSPNLNTHSDQFDKRSQYGQVYYKTATMLYNLQYVLGDKLFQNAMQHYFNQWSFCHPYFNDFRTSIIQFTKVDLNWFFDQWLESDASIDYKVDYLRKKKNGRYELSLSRRGMQMPIDFSLIDKKGEEHKYHIPNSYFVKDTEANVLPKWYGWGDFNSNYKVELDFEGEVDQLKIDPSERLADVYQLDNHLKTPVRVELNDFQWTRPDQAYELEWNPTIWYNGVDGLKGGLHVKGDYASVYHKLDAIIWFNSALGNQVPAFDEKDGSALHRFNYVLSYSDPLRKVGRDLSYKYESRWLEGLFANDFHITKGLPNDKSAISVSISGLYRPDDFSLDYLLYPDEWKSDQWNNFSQVKFSHFYRYAKQSSGKINAEMRSPFLFSDYQYGFLNLEVVNDNHIGFLNWRTRLFAQYGVGANWAPESQLYAAGANPEQLMTNAISRSVGLIPGSMYGMGIGTGNFQAGGGLNLRGYNNYLMPELNADSLLRFGNIGQSGLAFSTEIEFDDALSILPKYKRLVELKTYCFADVGIININRVNENMVWSNIRADAGIGTALEIKRWGKLSDFKPVTIRFDMPLFLNRPPAGEEFVAFRWLIGLQRSF
ncbi:MAG: M1 family metallopeptidase [Salibacteraceae bacterium]